MTSFIIACVPGCFYVHLEVVDEAFPCPNLCGAVEYGSASGRTEAKETLLTQVLCNICLILAVLVQCCSYVLAPCEFGTRVGLK